MSELEIIKQNPGQSVSDYTQKFKMLMQRVDTTEGFGQHYIVSKFVRELLLHLMTIIVGHSPQTLDAAITKAKEIETGFTIAQPIQQQQIMNQLVKSLIKCIEKAKPYFRILANTAKSEEEEYEDEALFEMDLFQFENENEERKIHSDSEIDKDELEQQVTVKALIPKEIISTRRTDIRLTPYVNYQIPLKLEFGIKIYHNRKECLAVRWSIKHFDYYLCYQPFEVVTDHSALNWLLTTKHVKG
ncbi:9132_t:CDS:2 [Funneliformis geosporum]|nr:9132_t:CDS:2 [Funneliformis geosporum]